jgi:hypothetical protein
MSENPDMGHPSYSKPGEDSVLHLWEVVHRMGVRIFAKEGVLNAMYSSEPYSQGEAVG